MNSFTESRKPEPGGGGHNDPSPFNISRNICKSVAEKFLLKINKNQNVENKEIYRNKWISFNKIHVFHLNFLFCDCLL